MKKTEYLEIERRIPITAEVDLCVIGGSCTGVFAAIRAARLGARVALVESQNSFGGVATNSMVNVWHTLLDAEFKKQIIGGLTEETLKRLEKRGAVQYLENNPSMGSLFNSEELKIELDEMVTEAGIKVYLHTLFTQAYEKDGSIEAIVIENKSGRSVVRAKQFVDASGDGDVAARLGLETRVSNSLQPATTCARFSNWESLGDLDTGKAIR
ncbi:MAG: FAD-dependent oxidoreductase, partial [Spirochaetia bacterium]|nr:FAD-dependent oxidoreductase [Spirochaetia bacterium]